MPYAVQVIVWVVVLALIGNLVGLGIQRMNRRRL
jgi:hypothetical protein